MRVVIRCIALAPVALLLVLMVLVNLVADWVEERAARDDEEGELHA